MVGIKHESMRKGQTSHKKEHNTRMCFPLKPVFTRNKGGLPNFMDEPFNGLDLQTKKRVIDELENLNKQGTTILWSSHEINQLREMSDRYVFINCGKIVGHMKNEKKYKAECHEDPLEQYYFEVCKNV